MSTLAQRGDGLVLACPRRFRCSGDLQFDSKETPAARFWPAKEFLAWIHGSCLDNTTVFKHMAALGNRLTRGKHSHSEYHCVVRSAGRVLYPGRSLCYLAIPRTGNCLRAVIDTLRSPCHCHLTLQRTFLLRCYSSYRTSDRTRYHSSESAAFYCHLQ